MRWLLLKREMTLLPIERTKMTKWHRYYRIEGILANKFVLHLKVVWSYIWILNFCCGKILMDLEVM